MSRRFSRYQLLNKIMRKAVWFLWLSLFLGPGLTGCGGKPSAKSAGEKPDPKLFQVAFKEATYSANAPPPGAAKPVDKTLTGKNTPAVLEEIQRVWDSIYLLGPDGAVLERKVILETDQGEIEITLAPSAAPNHVRNFLALVQTGFLDGLRFERVRKEEVVGEPELNVFSLEGGCPLGTGETGGGNLGYWLRSEAGDRLKMEKGVVGACLGEGADTASCRFFILLGDAPSLQGKNTAFGRVTRGLDVALAIAKKSLEDNPDGVEPAVIQKARLILD